VSKAVRLGRGRETVVLTFLCLMGGDSLKRGTFLLYPILGDFVNFFTLKIKRRNKNEHNYCRPSKNYKDLK
jgi:hypothetical protein